MSLTINLKPKPFLNFDTEFNISPDTIFIAECGINHNGNLDLAKKMIIEAANAGADIVKFQTFWGIKRLEKYEFTKEEWILLKSFCDSIGIEFMTSAHWGTPSGEYKENYEVIDFVNSLVKRHKIASSYLTNRKYIDYITKPLYLIGNESYQDLKGKPLIISTGSIVHKNGLALLSEVKRTLGWVNGDGRDITLLHCVSKYPTRARYFNRIKQLKQFGKPVGISDHTKNIDFPMALPIIEKHFMVDENCIDANVSLNPEKFRLMVKTYRNHYE